MSLDFVLRCPHCRSNIYDICYSSLAVPLWKAAGIYDALYKSDGEQAVDIAPVIHAGAQTIRAEETRYRLIYPSTDCFDALADALRFLDNLAHHMDEHPTAIISVYP